MKAKTQRLWILVASLACIVVAVGLMLLAFQENITFFYAPSDLTIKQVPLQQRIRLGGMVEKGSIVRQGTTIKFAVTDFKTSVPVEFEGIAPDLFREGQGVVAEGYLTSPGYFKASTLLAKHDENYMPPELANMGLTQK